MPMYPAKYLPRHLSQKDYLRQKRHLRKTRRAYKQGMYLPRPHLTSFHGRSSRHVRRAQQLYKINAVIPTPALAQKTGCSLKGLRDIVRKGRGAYYSSGSRPNQTAESWARARLASAITGAKACRVDHAILEKACAPHSLPLRLCDGF